MSTSSGLFFSAMSMFLPAEGYLHPKHPVGFFVLIRDACFLHLFASGVVGPSLRICSVSTKTWPQLCPLMHTSTGGRMDGLVTPSQLDENWLDDAADL